VKRGLCRRFLESQVTSKPKDFHAQAWFEGCFRSTSLLEPICKAVLPLIGIFLELYFHGPVDICYRRMMYDGAFDRLTVNVWLHTCLYAGVCFSGVMDLLVYFEYLPRNFDKAAHLLIFVNQGMLFAVHLKGSELSIMMHKILLGLIFSYVAAAAIDFYFCCATAEAAASDKNRGNRLVVAALLRPFFLYLMGVWIIQTGVVLFPGSQGYRSWEKKWNSDEHAVMMVVPMYLSFFALTIFCVSVLWMWCFTFFVLGHKNAKLLFRDSVGKNEYVEL
jgi:hypothetical protein